MGIIEVLEEKVVPVTKTSQYLYYKKRKKNSNLISFLHLEVSGFSWVRVILPYLANPRLNCGATGCHLQKAC